MSSNPPAFAHVAPRQPVGDIVTVIIGERATWTTRGRIEPGSRVTLPRREADRLISEGRAR